MNEIITTEEVNSQVEISTDPIQIAKVILPRIEYALELARTPEEANTIRSQIETVQTYLKRELPKFVKERWEGFESSHTCEMLYLKASAKAGQLWAGVE